MTKTRSILLVFLALCACDQDEQTKTTTIKKELTEEAAKLVAPLTDDPMVAAEELEERLRTRVKVSDGLVFLNDPASGIHVLPITTPWVVNCGKLGVSVNFGMAVSRDEGEQCDSLDVSLSLASVEPSTCGVAALTLAKSLQVMFQNTGSRETKAGAERTIPFPTPGVPQD